MRFAVTMSVTTKTPDNNGLVWEGTDHLPTITIKAATEHDARHKCKRWVDALSCDGSKEVNFSLFDLDALDLISPKNLSQ
jgi:hypothetical protein